MNEPFKYDVFMSYSAHDQGEARALAERLRRDGLRVWPGVFDDASERQPDEARRNQSEAGLEQARTLVLLMSQHASAAEWVTFEQHAVRFRDPLPPRRRLLPVRLPVRLHAAEMRDALKPFALVDWRLRSEEQYARLLAACRPMDNVNSLSSKDIPIRFGGVAVTANGQRIISS